ncbi:MAG: hypothetical protein ACKVIN_07920, partial [Longimicrobiales bacterium]
LYDSLVESGAEPPLPGALFLEPSSVTERLAALPRLDIVSSRDLPRAIEASPPPEIDRDMARLDTYLKNGEATAAETLLLCDNDGQLQRLEEILGGPRRLPMGTRVGLGALAGG